MYIAIGTYLCVHVTTCLTICHMLPSDKKDPCISHVRCGIVLVVKLQKPQLKFECFSICNAHKHP